jgi:hypothetical protein
VTEAAGDSGLVVAEIGYGPPTANPQHEAGWTFVPATFNMQFGNDDEYQADLATLPAGSYGYVFRVSLDGGASFTYCDIDGAGSDAGLTFETTQIASMLVTP